MLCTALGNLVSDRADLACLSKLAGPGPYRARSASDHTDDWPFWYVCGADGRRNVLSFTGCAYGAALTSREVAQAISDKLNAEAPT